MRANRGSAARRVWYLVRPHSTWMSTRWSFSKIMANDAGTACAAAKSRSWTHIQPLGVRACGYVLPGMYVWKVEAAATMASCHAEMAHRVDIRSVGHLRGERVCGHKARADA